MQNEFDFQAWADDFLGSPQKPLSEEMSYCFLNMLTFENTKSEIPDEVKNKFLYKVIDGRARQIGLDITNPAKVFLMFLTKSPGAAVMYLYALRSKGVSCSMDSIADLFPAGFPSEAALEDLWDQQKGASNGVPVDNCLDSYTFK